MPSHDVPKYRPMQRRRSTSHHAAPPPHVDDPVYGTPSRAGHTYRGRATQRLHPHRPGWWWKGLVLLPLLLAAGGLAGLTWLGAKYDARIYPNVALQGVDVSGMSVAEAEQAVTTTFAAFLEQPVTITYQNQTWQPSLAELGVTLDLQRNVAAAYAVGRQNGFIANLQEAAALFQHGVNRPLVITLDGATLQAYLRRIAAEIEQAPREAALILTETQVRSVDSLSGRMVLLDMTAADITTAVATLQPTVVPLLTSELIPALESPDIMVARRTIETMLATPLTLRSYDTTYQLKPATVADMILIQRTSAAEGTAVTAALDQAKLTKWVSKLANTIGRASAEPRIAWNGGNLEITREGRLGYRLDIPRAVEMINRAVISDSRDVQLPLDEIKPRVSVDTLTSLGITELIATGKSDFAGSAPYRITNIKAGASIIDGILVAPGEEFSFNDNVGNIDAANGFVEGYAIIGNRTQLEWGGGICQISTTLFRAAFYAGLPFTEKNPHRFRISWYEKYDTIGMDAAIFTGGGPDLRFVNDTSTWLLIESSVNDAESSVTYAIYGTKVPGRTVERSEAVIGAITPAPTEPVYIDDVEQPVGAIKQTDVARDGMEIEIVRSIKQDGEVVRSDTFVTKFEAWPNIYVKHPQTAGPASQ